MRAVVWRSVRGRVAVQTRRSFFTPPPLPPGLSPPPAASDAQPFFKSPADKHVAPASSTPISSRDKNSSKSSTTTPLKTAAAPDVEGDAGGVLHNNSSSSFSGGNSDIGCFQQQMQPHHLPAFLSPEKLARHVPKPAKFAASLVADALKIPAKVTSSSPTTEPSGELRQEYSEHCVLGWSPRDLYRVVADVSQYSTFLPWCIDSIVHNVTRLEDNNDPTTTSGSGTSSSTTNNNINNGSPMEMLATLTVGFSFFKEKYTSQVLLVPDRRVQAVLTEDDDRQRRSPVLSDLRCVWEFSAVPGHERQVEVRFRVSFAFRNPLHSKLVMSHVVTLMTRSFERHCEKLYGPPSCERERLAPL
ncbi:putative coenzyme Q-binding protein COQ10 B, mitochondrial-like [Trypanosoma grayi]|uniref:putative coenzyme Q-binding protein COQ10 B, mitochondrial-like n=1 Tax=Trypanosoma grayi TaxID=71804 RepID=UPI0004F4A8B0|nr:putative coenzyme Q-binding protein COQ10 B, mitochondrial-like [Trypanosoma grayi]KEG08569.1 putative coenzyme Q-binding protein COQ10 B, mitochondrial-like [Trypanosoma grayi]